MILMLEKLYDALRAANAPEEKARAAAIEVAGYETAIGELRSIQRILTFNTAALALLLISTVPALYLARLPPFK